MNKDYIDMDRQIVSIEWLVLVDKLGLKAGAPPRVVGKRQCKI